MAALTQERIALWISPWLDPTLSHYQIDVAEVPKGFEANISMQDWQIRMAFDFSFLPRMATILGLPDEAAAQVPGADTAAMLYLHEVGHWKYCPFDSEGHERILSGLAEGLSQEFGRQPPAKYLNLLSNMFSDVVLNAARVHLDPDAKSRETFRQGWAAACRFVLHGETGVGPVTAAYLGLQHRLLRPGDPVLDTIIATCAKATKVEDAIDGLTRIFSSGSVMTLDRLSWESQAWFFAQIFSRLIKQDEQMDAHRAQGPGSASSPSEIFPTAAEEASREAGPDTGPNEYTSQRDLAGAQPPDPEIHVPLCDENPFTRKFREDRSYREELIRHALRRSGRAADVGFASERDVVEVLYNEKAEEVVLKAEQQDEPARFPVAHAGVRRVADGRPPSLGSIKWSASRFYPTQGWQFYQKVHPLTVPRAGPAPPGKLPDLLFVLDSSQSMRWTKAIASEGEYDLALTAFFGVRRWLERTGLGYYLKYAAINFSDTTISTRQWYGYECLDPVLDVLLQYQGRGTRLSVRKLQQLAGRALGPFWTIMISDGEIENWRTAVETFKVLHARGNLTTLVQIGQATLFSNSLEAVGAEVKVIASASDLVGLVLGEARKTWSLTT